MPRPQFTIIIAIVSLLSFLILAKAPAGASDVHDLEGFKPWTGDLEGMKKRRVVRILVPYSKTIYFVDRGRPYGTAVELGQALEKWLNEGKTRQIDMTRVAFVAKPRDQLLPALVQGLGDIAAGNLTITPERRKTVDFTAPFVTDVREVLVTGPGSPPVASIADLAGKEVFLRPSSSYREHVEAANLRLRAEQRPAIAITGIDEHLEDEDLLEMVNAGLLPWAIVDEHKAGIWTKVLPNLKIRPEIAFSESGEIAWAIRKDSPQLKAELDAFIEKHRIGTTFGNVLRKRYYRDDKMLRRANASAEQAKFREFLDLFRKHGEAYSFDYLLLAAQGYQESQLDQKRRSPRGAVGVMQLMPATAADKAVGVRGIDKSADRNIEAGAKYLRHLIDTYIDDPQVDERNRFLFALAAYNAGPGNLGKFRRRAVEMDLDPNRWFGNVENAAADIVGRETVQYVSNIYMYFVAYSLLSDIASRKAAEKTRIDPDQP
ncbi:MAG: transglycosylase SLT domain-containing protein [Aestuariivirga sp.]